MTLRPTLAALALTLGGLLATGAPAAADGMPEGLDRELAIFEEILRTSLQTADTGRLRAGKVDASYLAEQGALLQLRVSGHGTHWHMDVPDFDHHVDLSGLEDLDDIPGVSREFIESIPDIVDDAMTSVRIGLANLSEERREALEEQQEVLDDLREVEDDLRDEVRELRDERRDAARELRNLERDGEGGSSDAQRVRSQIAEFEEREAAKVVELEQHRGRVREQREALRAQAQRAREQARMDLGAQWTAFDATMLDTLCGYGATLRSLPDDEHLNVIVSGAVRADGSRGERIYVFRKKDLDGCRSADTLRGRAAIYDS